MTTIDDYLTLEPVTAWIDGMQDQTGTADDPRPKVELLMQFADFVGASPQEMLDECLNYDAGRIRAKGRRDYVQKMDEFSKTLPGSPADQFRQVSIIRSFFIHNGVFLNTPKAPWL